ncbi:MAG: dienelactone hydrolase family protein [Rhodobiaceae bacterium]|nr:dienelactone hydrolase family protein [Rhodobiaceae bacterium]MCC0060451.1 dienelactone hydrolase family protein [Rhodobiaceae bacterium]
MSATAGPPVDKNVAGKGRKDVPAIVGNDPPRHRDGRSIWLRAEDGHSLDAWCVEPDGDAHWGAVILQEIFGVNAHVRETCERYADLGACAIAPALFDRAQRKTELDYNAEGVAIGRELRERVGWDAAVADVKAAVDEASRYGPVCVIGYCWGGTLAFLSATRFDNVACAISYYGGQTVPFAHEKIAAPVMMHFGSEDPRIPEADREIIQSGNPGIEAHVYPADHGFNCDHRKEFHAPSAALSMERNLAFLAAHIGAGRINNPET